MRHVRLAVVVVIMTFVAVACGGGSSSAPTVAPSPLVSLIQYPNLVGGWSGTMTIVAVVNGLALSNTCTHSWNVSGESSGAFSGTWQLSGGTTVACASSGTLSGTVSTSGYVQVGFNTTLGNTASCKEIGTPSPYTGTLAGRSLALQTSDTVQCTTNGVTVEGTRSLAIALTEQ